MKVTNLALLVTYVYLIIFFVLCIKLYVNVEETNIISSFKDKIELSLDAATLIDYELLSDEDKEKVSNGDFDNITLDKDKIFEEFIKVLSLNCPKDLNLTKYIEKLMIINNDGLIVNYAKENGDRV
ncbi:MAG: hypothetical protein MJ246_05480 [Clostridia bacterium]|nr:hypothetical protein [Clostridia bacterium]